MSSRLRNLLGELSRRRIFGAVTAYAIGAWLLIQVASVILPAFDAPAWTMRALIIATVVGAPVAVVVAWLFDLTPRGFVRTESAAESARAGASASAEQPEAMPTEPSAPAAQQPVTGPERKQVTVLHAAVRLHGRGRAELDPEIHREIVPAVRDACLAVAKRYGGQPALAPGNDVVVYFGVPLAHENDPERAARAGLEMIETAARIHQERGAGAEATLDLRVTLHTGTVVVEGSGPPMTLVGDSVSWPAAMQVHAGPNELLVSAATRLRLGDLVQAADLGERALGDRSAERLYRVDSIRQWDGRVPAEAVTELVGREREIALLDEKWNRARSGNGQAVFVSGEPGIGKSRIAQSVEANAARSGGARVLAAQCSPYHQERSLYPIAGMLQRDLFALEQEQNDAERVAALERNLGARGWNLAEAMPLIAPLLSLEARHARLHLAPERQQQLLLEYLVSLLLETAEASPLLFVIEDLHWADEGTIRLVGMLLDQLPTARILLLGTHRPEFDPPWAARSNLVKLAMDRLPEDHTARIVARVAEGRHLPASVVRRIIERADGVPLFVEELTKTLLEAGAAEAGDASVVIPATLQDSLAARLDRLGSAKRLAQIAATIGREFSRALLASVADLDEAALDQQIDALVEGEFVFRRGVGTRARFVFKHALIQDAAYATLLRSSRREYHGRIARALVEHFPDVCETQPEIVALHFSAAAMYEEAVTYGLAAAQSAARRSANGEAVQHLRHCVEWLAKLPPGVERNRSELRAQMMLMPALVGTKGYGAQELEQTSSRALELCEAIGDSPDQVFALFGLWMFHVVRANHARSVALADKFAELARPSGDDDLLVEAELIVGIAHFFVADLDVATRHFTECQRIYHPERHRDHGFRFGQDPHTIAGCYLSWIRWLRGDSAGALRVSRDSVDGARKLGHPLTLSFALSFAAWLRVYLRDVTEARTLTDELTALCESYGIEVFLAHGRVLAAWLDCDAGGGNEALKRMSEGIAYFRSLGARCFLPLWESKRARAAVAVGDVATAREALDRACEDTAVTGELWAAPEVERARALVLRLEGADRASIARALEDSKRLARELDTPAWLLRTTQTCEDLER